ncbi:MAG: alpha/beta fold hydrolase [Candidatus Daviesbacteria bacterium]|nr:alpha/beta fold hydrolase [Candidatus Daviesbacteria bacterium]
MLLKEKKVEFVSDGIKLSGTLYYPNEIKSSPGVLFLHGGGQSSKERFLQWQEHLSRLGICSLTFDFRGVGESEGQFADSSLKNRLIDSRAALNFLLSYSLVDRNKIAIVGSSMGAYVAIRLSELGEAPKALILVSAAAYAKESEDKQMDVSFTQVIRTENSWCNSTCFLALKRYQNPVMVVYGSEDLVIPEGVKKRYKGLLKSQDIYLVMKNGQHTLLDPKKGLERKAFKQLLNESSKFLARVFEL